MIKVCHICLKSLDRDEEPAAWIRPKGAKTRYYCLSCWKKELLISSGSADPIIEANHKEVNQ